MRHLESVQSKLVEMETRHRQREQQLQQLLQQQSSSWCVPRDDVTSRWRSVVDEKTREMDRFRAELDAILQLLGRLVVSYNCDHAVTHDSSVTEAVNYSLDDHQPISRTT